MADSTFIVDAHLDLAYNARSGYDPRLPLDEARASRIGKQLAARGETPTVTLPALAEAGVGLVFGTLFVLPAGAPSDLAGEIYSTAEEAHTSAWRQIDYYRSLEEDGLVRIVERRSDVQELIAAKSAAKGNTPLGLVLLMEGADPLREPAELERWTERGLRIVGPAWNATRYCGGTGMPGGLTAAGRALMGELNRTGTALDTSHLAEESFWQALRLYRGPVIASHSNCRQYVPTDRQLSDDMIRAIIDRDGVIGVVLYNRFLNAEWNTGDRKSAIRLETLVRHIEHICELAHDTRHVGIGSDLDGGFGREGIPAELDSCVDLPLIGDVLARAGWRADEVAGVMGGNWVRWLGQALPA